jgi:LDH2 family malate/lactate/ureidoglycolate dehydrogenase
MSTIPTTHFIQARDLRCFTATVFEQAGVSADRAADAADVLVWANLHGVDTHGVRNLRPLYIQFILGGRIRANGEYRIEHETPFSARVDGGGGLGLAAACWGMRLAIHKAQQAGVGLVAMRNSYHFGAAGYYPCLALAHDMIGIALTGRLYAQGAELGVLPTFGAKPMLSTNPIAISFPTLEELPFLLDMATSAAPYNRVLMHRELGKPVPAGWGLDSQGQPTTDPATLRHLLPLGGSRELGGHKGYGLAMMVEVLCAVLSGGWHNLFPDDPRAFDGHVQDNDAHFFGAMRIDAFRPVEEFKRGMDAMIRALRAAPKALGHDRIYVAGEIEHETAQQRLRDGIPLPENVAADLRALSAQFSVPLPLV